MPGGLKLGFAIHLVVIIVIIIKRVEVVAGRWTAGERVVSVWARQCSAAIINARQLCSAASVIVDAAPAVVRRRRRQTALRQLRSCDVVRAGPSADRGRCAAPSHGRRPGSYRRVYAAAEPGVRLLDVDGQPGCGSRGTRPLSDDHRLPR